jgi:hypothetical protein
MDREEKLKYYEGNEELLHKVEKLRKITKLIKISSVIILIFSLSLLVL